MRQEEEPQDIEAKNKKPGISRRAFLKALGIVGATSLLKLGTSQITFAQESSNEESPIAADTSSSESQIEPVNPNLPEDPDLDDFLLRIPKAEAEELYGVFLRTKVGVEKRSSVERFPGRNQVKTPNPGVLKDGSYVYFFRSASSFRDTLIITQNLKQGDPDQTAVFKSLPTVDAVTYEHPDFTPYLEKYGKPDLIIDIEAYGDNASQINCYLNRGISFVINKFTKEVLEVQVFMPITAQQFSESWGQLWPNPKIENPSE